MSNFIPLFTSLHSKVHCMQQCELQRQSQKMVIDDQVDSPPPIDEEIFNSSEGVQESPPTRKRKHPSSQSLVFLAEVAESVRKKKQRVDDLEMFCGLVKAFVDYKDPIFIKVADLYNVNFQNLEEKFAKIEKLFIGDELQKLIPLLRWYCLLKMGDLPGVELEGIKGMLGINYFIEMIIPQKSEVAHGTHQWSMEYLSKLIDFHQYYKEEFIKSQSSNCYLKITKEVFETIYKALDTECLFSNINSCFEFEDAEYLDQFTDYFDQMDTCTRLRWVLFASVASFQLSDSNEGLTAKPGIWPSVIPKEILPLVKKIDYHIVNMNDKQSSSTDSPTESGDKFNFMSFFTAPKIKVGVDLPGMPNWMPNGGDSCYVSSTLWSLFLIANQDIQQKIREFRQEELAEEEASKALIQKEQIDFSSKSTRSAKKRKVSLVIEEEPKVDKQTLLIKKAKREFCQLYADLASQEIKKISISQVNRLRRAMQLAFPEHYIAPRSFSQEDAYEFLVCIVQSLWNLDSCLEGTPKFQMLHKFIQVGEDPLVEPVHYKYDEALQSAYISEPTPIVNVPLNDGKMQSITFRDLVTRVRQTEQVERHVYRKEEWNEGPKYHSINTDHSEQLIVESKERAPEYFIGRLTRFHQDLETGFRSKRFDVVVPNASLEFNIKGEQEGEERVAYDLAAITVHIGRTIDGGHYYTYIRKKVEGNWKFFRYDDIAGTRECHDVERVISDAAINGYIYYYKKRGDDDEAPTSLPFENEVYEKLGSSRKRKAS